MHWAWDHCQFCDRLCFKQTRLLQRGVRRSTGFHYCSTSASLERSSATRQRSQSARSYDISTAWLTGCLIFSIVSATNYVYWCTLYIPAIVHLICRISIVTTTANIPSRIRLRSARTHRYEPLTMRLKLGLKLGTACPVQAIQEITDSNILSVNWQHFVWTRVIHTVIVSCRWPLYV